ncbi:hypothetical protein KKF34_05180 [Myxococcota bacterium]|nr:hypothetical protein [Myxococcota bacterium]MBU1380904.1 hypothetical protein [Myxococcota bacterium]MBU1496253.1 hypothetical protein [Myxococcota bacterium]
MKKNIIIVTCLMGACGFTDSPKDKFRVPEVRITIPVSNVTTKDVDVLFQVDSSNCMRGDQEILKSSMFKFVRLLQNTPGGMPNMHIGVITSDVGPGITQYPDCVSEGNDGLLVKGGCSNPEGSAFVVDVNPAGCQVNRTEFDTCSSHDCSAENCLGSAFISQGRALEPDDLELVMDDKGCPRCRNYGVEKLDDVLKCMVDVGTSGCSFEMHFESLRRAFVPGKNPGFIREGAVLAYLLTADEDDCTVSDRRFFDFEDISLDGELGPASKFRCTEHGLICDQPWKRTFEPNQGEVTYTGCRPRTEDDENNLLMPVSEISEFFAGIKPRELLIARAIAGPYNEGIVKVTKDENSWPNFFPICGGDISNGARNGIRIREFINQLIQYDRDIENAVTSICDPSFEAKIDEFVGKIQSTINGYCPVSPIAGCPDPGFSLEGTKITSLGNDFSAVCDPYCKVTDISPDGTSINIEKCSTDYASGHPEIIDPALPVQACFHAVYDAECAKGENFGPSRGIRIVVSRRAKPAPGILTTADCATIPISEAGLCLDDIDNDYDGLVDTDDPDCLGLIL